MPSLQLRPRQEAAIEKVQQAFRDGYKNVMLQAPCGFGKTELATAMLIKTHDNLKRGSFVCDRLSLVEQTGERFDQYDLPYGVMQSMHWRFRPWERIQLCSIQTIQKRGWPQAHLIMADEAHVLPKTLIERIEKRDCFTVGLSATPLTRGLGKYFDIVVNAATTNQLIAEGSLVPFDVFCPSEPDMTGVKVVAGEWDEKEAEAKIMPIVGDCVAEYLKHGRGEKFICFAQTVTHAKELQRQFAGAGVITNLYTYRESDEEKKAAVSEFRKRDSYIRGLISIESLTRGFDVADVGVLIIARLLRKALAVHIQMLGRLLRTAPGKEKGLVLDHAGNCQRFWDATQDFFENGIDELDDGKRKDKKKPVKKDKEAVKCPKCFRIHEQFTCPSCGYEPEKTNLIEHAPGELAHFSGTGKDPNIKQNVYSQLLYIAQARGYESGWIGHKYLAMFNVWPRGMKDYPLPPSDMVKNFVKREAKAYSKSVKS